MLGRRTIDYLAFGVDFPATGSQPRSPAKLPVALTQENGKQRDSYDSDRSTDLDDSPVSYQQQLAGEENFGNGVEIVEVASLSGKESEEELDMALEEDAFIPETIAAQLKKSVQAGLPLTLMEENGKQRNGYDSDHSSDFEFSPASCPQQFAGEEHSEDDTESTEVASLTSRACTEELDMDPEEHASAPVAYAIQLPMPALACDHMPELTAHPKDEDAASTSPRGRGRDTGSGAQSLGSPEDKAPPAWARIRTPSPTPWRCAYSAGAHAPPPPVLGHVPRHIATLLRPMSSALLQPELSQSACGEAVVSAGSAGHPFCCAQPCKYYTKSKKGCKDGESCRFCHLCKWTKSCRKKSSGSPVSA